MTSTERVASTLVSLTAAPIQHADRITMMPLCSTDARSARSYLTAPEAFERDLLRVSEVSDVGWVQELRVTNTADKPVLLLDGEHLLGAKQHRVVNATILVPAKTTLTIPVSCVEQHRWHWATAAFTPAPVLQHASGRARKMSAVRDSLLTHGHYLGRQTDVWEDVAALSASAGVTSRTGELNAVFEQLRPQLEAVAASFILVPDQVGAIMRTTNGIIGLELADHPDTWQALVAKVVQSYGVDAIRRDITGSTRGEKDFLHMLARGQWDEHASIGHGQSLRFSAQGIEAAALEWNGTVVHLSAVEQAHA